MTSAGPADGPAALRAGAPRRVLVAMSGGVDSSVAAALLAHLLLELGGRREVAPWLPFSGRTWRGRRLWDERGGRATVVACALAAGILAAILLAGR